MNRPSDSNECHRCPDHASLWPDGPVTLKVCRRCWLEWQTSMARVVVHKHFRAFMAHGHDEAAPRQIREEVP